MRNQRPILRYRGRDPRIYINCVVPVSPARPLRARAPVRAPVRVSRTGTRNLSRTGNAHAPDTQYNT